MRRARAMRRLKEERGRGVMVWTRTLHFWPRVGRVVGRLVMMVRLRMGRKALGTQVSVPPRHLMTKVLRRFRLVARSVSARQRQKRPRVAQDLDLDPGRDLEDLDRDRPDALGPNQATGPDQALAPGLMDPSQAPDLGPGPDLGTAGDAPLGPGALVCICGEGGGKGQDGRISVSCASYRNQRGRSGSSSSSGTTVAAVAAADTWLWAPLVKHRDGLLGFRGICPDS